jgi:regulator of protease activity HflC (stomatin/prohibitin superfamily)
VGFGPRGMLSLPCSSWRKSINFRSRRRNPLDVDQARGAVAAGSLSPGDQLPTVRQLAVDFEINPNTVVRAYRELEYDGLIETHQGTGTFISGRKLHRPADEPQRLGHYVGLRGPGIFTAESTLSRDTVLVDVDAIIFWLVWNAEKAILEVENYLDAITLSAQTALRESIGPHELAQLITDREALGRELQRVLDEKTNPWGITIQSVEVRDVRIPQALQDAMPRQAQAERERQARIILGQAETEISEKFVKAGEAYSATRRPCIFAP